MELILKYDFHEKWQDGPEAIRVDVNNFEYKLEVEGDYDYDALKEKYREVALELAAYKIICEYADFCF